MQLQSGLTVAVQHFLANSSSPSLVIHLILTNKHSGRLNCITEPKTYSPEQKKVVSPVTISQFTILSFHLKMYIINSSTTTQLILLLLASLLTSLTFPLSASPIYNYHACTDTSYYQPNSNFQTTLKTLLSSLVNSTLHNTFYTSHIPLFNSPNDLKGLFLCRANVTPSICHLCVTAAANNITILCKNQTESIIWYDQCFLRYSNDSFLNHMVPEITLDSDESLPDSESTQFSDFLANFLKGLAYETVNSPSGQKFAAKEENFLGSMKVYSLAECTPDLSMFECNTCLQGAISSIGNCYNGKRGARSLLPSCNIRYEFYPFYNVSSVSTQPKFTSPSSGIKYQHNLCNNDLLLGF